MPAAPGLGAGAAGAPQAGFELPPISHVQEIGNRASELSMRGSTMNEYGQDNCGLNG